MSKKKKIPDKLQAWIVARKRHRLSHAHVQMARELGMNPKKLRTLADGAFSMHRCWHHYRSMASKNYREYLKGEQVRRKKYLYVLRPLLAMRWLEEGRGPAPMEFRTLLDEITEAGDVRTAIDRLVTDKMAGKELDDMPRLDVLNRFIEAELARADTVEPPEDTARADLDELNEFFRKVAGG